MKAKYYPQCSILEAPLGASPSFSWRSIWNARALLLEGLRWRVGNGDQIGICTDKWVPQLFSFKICSPPSYLGVEAKEHFTVRSAYHLEMGLRSRAEHASSSTGGTDRVGFWKTFCNMRIPTKIKVFDWKLCLEILSVRAKLQARKILTNADCSLCLHAPESIHHCFFDCPFAKKVWACSCIAQVAHRQRGGSLFDWNLEFLSSVDCAIKELFWVLCWCIWTNRNQVVFQNTAQSEREIAWFASDYYQEVCAVQTCVWVSPHANMPTRWFPPAEGLFKANFDGACSAADEFIGVGVVVRDHQGAVIAALSAKRASAMDVDCMEAFAALAAIQFALDLGLHHIIFEGDSLTIVRAFHSVSKSLATFGHFVEQAKSLLPRFHSWAVQHVKREGNSVAHCLVRMAFAMEDFSIWMEDVPLSLHSLVRREASL